MWLPRIKKSSSRKISTTQTADGQKNGQKVLKTPNSDLILLKVARMQTSLGFDVLHHADWGAGEVRSWIMFAIASLLYNPACAWYMDGFVSVICPWPTCPSFTVPIGLRTLVRQAKCTSSHPAHVILSKTSSAMISKRKDLLKGRHQGRRSGMLSMPTRHRNAWNFCLWIRWWTCCQWLIETMIGLNYIEAKRSQFVETTTPFTLAITRGSLQHTHCSPPDIVVCIPVAAMRCRKILLELFFWRISVCIINIITDTGLLSGNAMRPSTCTR